MKFSLYLLLSSLLVCHISDAVIITADIYSKKDAIGKDHYLICYGDFHMYKDTVDDKQFMEDCVKQKQYFIGTLAKVSVKSDVAVIVEDMEADVELDVDGIHYFNKDIQDSLHFLAITNQLQKLSIPVYNIEYRWLMLQNQAPIAHNLIVHGTVFKEVTEYNDLQVLNDFYRECIDRSSYENNPIIEDLCENQELTYKEYKEKKLIDQVAVDKYHEAFMYLIDARIVHKIYELQDKKIIVVAAGMSHIENIEIIFEKMGYAKIQASHKKGDSVHLNTVLPVFFDEINKLVK